MLTLRLYQLLRVVLFPVAWIYSHVFSERKKRYQLERRHNTKKASFNKADYAFEISSEGELEQVRSLLEDFLSQGAKVELIFCSDSVVTKCEELELKYEENLKLFVFPFLSYFPFFFNRSLAELITAPRVYLCRYDFFPEILELCNRRELYLLAATAKSLHKANWIKNWWYKKFFSRSMKIVTTTEGDVRYFSDNYPSASVKSFDFRQKRILDRIKGKDAKYQKDYPQIEQLKAKIKNYKYNIVLGSLWEADLPYISQAIWDLASKEELLIYILPHKLDRTSLANLEKNLSEIGVNPNKSIVIESTRGVLCELYTEFNNAFVGGGYLGSPGVHSLLEPYLAGCKISCGPSVERSTEYVQISEASSSVRIVTEEEKLNIDDLLAHDNCVSDNIVIDFLERYKRTMEFVR